MLQADYIQRNTERAICRAQVIGLEKERRKKVLARQQQQQSSPYCVCLPPRNQQQFITQYTRHLLPFWFARAGASRSVAVIGFALLGDAHNKKPFDELNLNFWCGSRRSNRWRVIIHRR